MWFIQIKNVVKIYFFRINFGLMHRICVGLGLYIVAGLARNMVTRQMSKLLHVFFFYISRWFWN